MRYEAEILLINKIERSHTHLTPETAPETGYSIIG